MFTKTNHRTSSYQGCVPFKLKLCFPLNFPLSTGTVTKKKVSGQLHIYPYDGRLFHPGVTCPTCQLLKPARSKHCSEYRCSVATELGNQEKYCTRHFSAQRFTANIVLYFKGSATGVSSALITTVSGWITALELGTRVTSCSTSSACVPWQATSPC